MSHVGSNPTLSASDKRPGPMGRDDPKNFGEMSEWPKEHDWKSCEGGDLLRGFESHSLRQPRSLLE